MSLYAREWARDEIKKEIEKLEDKLQKAQNSRYNFASSDTMIPFRTKPVDTSSMERKIQNKKDELKKIEKEIKELKRSGKKSRW